MFSDRFDFWYAGVKGNFFNIYIYIILMHFQAKSTLNHNRYHISKYSINVFGSLSYIGQLFNGSKNKNWNFNL